MKRKLTAGQTSVSLPIFIQDTSSTTGGGLGSLVFNTASLVAEYRRRGQSAWTAITLQTKTLGTWVTGGFIADGALAGAYELDLPDVVVASGARWVAVRLRGAANMLPCLIEIELDAFDYQTATQPVNTTQFAGQTITAAAGVTIPSSIASPTNITAASGVVLATLDSPSQHAGTAQAGSSTTITLAAGASSVTDYYVGSLVKIYGGTGSGQSTRTITAYNGTTKVATVGRAFATTPDSTSIYSVLADQSPVLNSSLQTTSLIVSGTGTGQLDVTSGVIKANLAQILGTALTETAGQIAAAFRTFFNVASPVATAQSVNQTGDSFARIGVAGAGLTAVDDATLAAIAALNNLSSAQVTAAVPTAAQNATAVEAAILNEGDATALLAAIAVKVEQFLINDGDANATIAAIAAACNAAVVAGTVGTNVVAVKSKTDNLPASPAAIGSAMTLTVAYDAAKTASTQTSVDDLPTNAELATALASADDAVLTAIAAEAVKTAAIKVKSDQLTFTVANKVDAAAVLDSSARVKLDATQPDYAPALASTALSTAQWTNTLATNLGTTNTTVATNLNTTVSSRSIYAGGAVASVIAPVSLDSATAAKITAIDTFATRMTTGLVVDGAFYQFTANMLELAPSSGGGAGDASQATLLAVKAKTDLIGTTSGISSLLAASVLTPGTITEFPDTLTIGDSYTTANGRSIQIPIVDTAGNQISSTGSLNFADATATFVVKRAKETDSTRIITGTAAFTDPVGTGTSGAPYAVVQLTSSETAKGLIGYKYSGVLTFTWPYVGTGTDPEVMSFETDTILFDN